MSMSNLKYTFHGCEKTHVKISFISMLVDRGKKWGSYKMEVIIRKVGDSYQWS
jgi:hypothetical protein